MKKQERFQKQKLNSKDNKGMEHGAKAARGVLSGAVLMAVLAANKDKLKTIGKGVMSIIKK